MCGASSQQNQLASEQAAFYQQATAEATQTFQEQQGILKQMQSVYSPILAKGPNQQGFSAGERENLNAQAVQGTAQNFAAASRALGNKQAAQGGGNMTMPSGAQGEQQAQLAAAGAAQESGEESQINQADWQTGRQEFDQATSAMENTAGQYNATGFENAATGAGSAANTTMNDISQENTAAFSAVTGAVQGAFNAAGDTGFL